MEEFLKKIIIKFDIDWVNSENWEILLTAYEGQKNVDEGFLKSIGIYVEPLDLRVYKKYKEQKERIKEWQK